MTFSRGNNKASKLDAIKVLAIRTAYANGRTTYEQLAREYQVTVGTIRNVVLGLTWQTVQEIPTEQALLRRIAAQNAIVLPTEDEQRAAAERIQARVAELKKPVDRFIDHSQEPDGSGLDRLQREAAKADPLAGLMDDSDKPTGD